MYPIWHFISSGILSFLLFPYFGWQILWILIGGFFVDFDHYLLYVGRFGKFSFIKAYKYFPREAKDFNNELCIFHTLEIIIPIFIVAFFWLPALLIFIGLMLHMIMDAIDDIFFRGGYKKAISLFVWLRQHKMI